MENGAPAPHKPKEVDGCWAWLVLFSAFTAMLLAYGQLINTGIYYVEFMEALQISRSTTQWIPTANMAATCFTGPVASLLLPKYGARMMLICGSLIMSTAQVAMFFANSTLYLIVASAFCGAGTNLVLVGAVAAVALYFDKYSYMATSIMNSGGGAGMVVMGLETEWVIQTFGWRGSMLIQAGISLQIVACGATVFPLRSPPHTPPPPAASSAEKRDVKGPEKISLFGDAKFWLLMASSFLFYGSQGIFISTALKDIVRTIAPHFDYKVFVTCFGVSNAVGRVLAGTIIASSSLLSPPVFYMATSLVSTILTLAFLTALPEGQEWLLGVLAASYGLFNGQQHTSLTLAFSYVFTRQLMPVLYGYAMLFGGIAIIVLNPIAGVFVDMSGGSYNIVIWMSFACIFLSGTLLFPTVLLKGRKPSKPSAEAPPIPLDTKPTTN